MRWIASAGGPLLLMPENKLLDWQGCFGRTSQLPTESGDTIHETDYDRACQITGYVGVIDVGGEQCLVLGDEPAQTAWAPADSKNAGMLVRWLFADNENELIMRLREIPSDVFRPDARLSLTKPSVLLFDSACTGRDVQENRCEFLSIELDPGGYQISTATYKPDETTCMVVHRFERA